MISQVNASTVRNAYASSVGENVKTNKNVGTENAKDTNKLSKVETLKAAIDSGEYKVDIDALSQKMADELL